jgi:hypothetical protein
MTGRIVVAAMVGWACVSAEGAAHAAGGTAPAVEIGLRSGYSLPLGDAAGGNPSLSLSSDVTGMVPIWVDAGVRLTPNFYVGANFQYGVAFVNTGNNQYCGSGVSCTSNDIMFGVDVHYHLGPAQMIDPWFGVGVGYEILNIKASESGESESGSFSGFQFLNLQLGVDLAATPDLGIGPFLMMSFDQYSSCSVSGVEAGPCTINQQAVHEWMTFGVRGAYDFHLM